MNTCQPDQELCLLPETIAAPRRARTRAWSAPLPPPAQPEAGEGLAMVRTYRRTGGLVSCDEAAQLLARHCDQPISRLARWIVERKAVTFGWQSQTLVPLFQFEFADMSMRPSVAAVVAELAGAFDDLELAQWFARPNCWLRNAAPVAVIETQPAAVLQAARADRYIARG